jgi:hypothetical protein
VHHFGAFPQLEDQMCAFSRGAQEESGISSMGYSPDRVDALVWALTELLVEPAPGEGIYEFYRQLGGHPTDAAGKRRP